MREFVRCCAHNRCPDRPKHFLGRFQTRPWICPQCGRWWITYHWSTYGGDDWSWKEATEGGAS